MVHGFCVFTVLLFLFLLGFTGFFVFTGFLGFCFYWFCFLLGFYWFLFFVLLGFLMFFGFLCSLLGFYIGFCFLVTLDAALLARIQYSEGPATGHLDTGFSRFPCAYKQTLRRFPTFQVATNASHVALRT